MDSNGFIYRYVAELTQRSGKPGVQVPLDVDWMPALESAWFEAARVDASASAQSVAAGHVEPMWSAEGEPYVRGVRASVPAGGGVASVEVPLAYFEDAARARITEWAQQGRLAAEPLVEFRVAAYRARAETGPRPRLLVQEETVADPFRGEVSIEEAIAGALPVEAPERATGMLVAIQGRVLQEAVTATREAGPVEAGGVLVGHLYRDRAKTGRVLAEVTAQVPATGARQELCELTFTADTWVAVDEALALRRKGEIRLGYWHSHPARYWCRNCPPENQKVCKLSGEFFSAHDKLLLRTVFPRAHGLGLLVSDSNAKGLTWALFGWRRGLIVRRGCFVLGRLPEVPEVPARFGGDHGTLHAKRVCAD